MYVYKAMGMYKINFANKVFVDCTTHKSQKGYDVMIYTIQLFLLVYIRTYIARDCTMHVLYTTKLLGFTAYSYLLPFGQYSCSYLS